MQQLDRRAEVRGEVALIAQRARHHDEERRAHALAARARDVLADLVHAAHVARELLTDDAVDGRHVFGDRSEKGADVRLGRGGHLGGVSGAAGGC